MEGQGSSVPFGATAAALQATLGAVPSQQHLATTHPQSGIIARCSGSVGEWRPSQGTVHLRQQRGSRWSVHGHAHGSTTVLIPEEALFLKECGALQLLHEEKLLSLQECYHCLLTRDGLPFYQVYAYLKRIGFIASKVCLYRSLSTPHFCVDNTGLGGVITSSDARSMDGVESCDTKGVPHVTEGQPEGAQLQPEGAPSDTEGAQLQPEGAQLQPEGAPHGTEGAQLQPEGAPCDTEGAQLNTKSACPLCVADQPDNLERLPMLEVYKPKKGTPFRKSQPGPPDFRVMIARPSEEFPSAERVRELCRIKPSCPLIVCVLEGASLSYYRLTIPS